MAKRSPLAERLEKVRERIAAACEQAHRDVREVTLVAVTKAAALEQIREIVQLGVGDLAENRVQSLLPRAAQINEFYQRRKAHNEEGLPAHLRWHMIGHLQRNKAKQILAVTDVIHSVDSLRLAEELETQATKAERKIPILLEVNTSGEASKTGLGVGAAPHLGEQIDSMPHLQLIGLMTMAPLTDDLKVARFAFSRLREIFEDMRWQKIGGAFFRHLSMGMSNDFEQAILEGATMIRVGTALFGGKNADQSDEPEGPDLETRLRTGH